MLACSDMTELSGVPMEVAAPVDLICRAAFEGVSETCSLSSSLCSLCSLFLILSLFLVSVCLFLSRISLGLVLH
jgi:hypothetical protein